MKNNDSKCIECNLNESKNWKRIDKWLFNWLLKWLMNQFWFHINQKESIFHLYGIKFSKQGSIEPKRSYFWMKLYLGVVLLSSTSLINAQQPCNGFTFLCSSKLNKILFPGFFIHHSILESTLINRHTQFLFTSNRNPT